MVDRMPVEEGWVYGQKPKDPEAPPDLESLFEAAGVPDKLTNGQPPFSPEWYAGAKERQRVRDAEIEKIMSQRNDVRHQWAELMWTDLSVWRDRIDYTGGEDRPAVSTVDRFASCMIPADDVARFQEIQEIAAKALTQSQDCLTWHATCHGLCQAGVRQGQVRKHLVEAKEQMMDIEAQTSPSSPSLRRLRLLLLVQGKVRLKEEEDEAAEKDRLEKKRLAEKRRRRAERALKRNEALLLGEDPPPLVEDSEEEGLQPEDDPKAVQAQLQGSVVLCYFCVACRSRI
ncbi:ADK2 [Symbiodinium sp. CCMP2592]|nr:ADK2 [Symbiodinium sp. CCMP2592]